MLAHLVRLVSIMRLRAAVAVAVLAVLLRYIVPGVQVGRLLDERLSVEPRAEHLPLTALREIPVPSDEITVRFTAEAGAVGVPSVLVLSHQIRPLAVEAEMGAFLAVAEEAVAGLFSTARQPAPVAMVVAAASRL